MAITPIAHQGTNHEIRALKDSWRNDVPKRVRTTTLCTDKPHLSQSPKRIAQMGQGKQRICPLQTSIPHSEDMVTTPPSLPTSWAISSRKWLLLQLVSECLIWLGIEQRSNPHHRIPTTELVVARWVCSRAFCREKSTSQSKPMTRHEAEQCRTSTTSAEAEEPMPSTPFRQGNCTHKFKN